ncbi:MAG: hypothetical protein JRC87_07635 [Deltaproteobacteria bacterium]|nr:hypothetical protein [Deltaproteobacteria bacterium]MBW2659445.1 hypothetical protein [Deltaproteobacteria bacterium]
MRLTDELDRQREEFLANAPAEIIEQLGDAMEQLRSSGIEGSAIQPGEKAPAIILTDTDNNTVELYDALRTGPVILKFFRGHW